MTTFISKLFGTDSTASATDVGDEVTLKTVQALSHNMMTIDIDNLPEGTVFKTHQDIMKVEVPKNSSKPPSPKGSPIWRNKFSKQDKQEKQKQEKQDKQTKQEATKSMIKRCKSIGKTYDVQLYGVLAKKVDKKNRPTRFVKRFFVLKEAFLVYFPVVSQAKIMRKWHVNMHPKGVISLANTTIGSVELEHHCGITISAKSDDHDDDARSNDVVLVCETELQRHKWIDALKRASQITCANASLSETMIGELEESGMRLHTEKQEYVDRLQVEADSLRKQIDRNQELEQLREELETEREILEHTAAELRGDLDNIKRDLNMMSMTKQTLELEKTNLNAKTAHLSSRMEKLETDKVHVEKRLTQIDREREQFAQQNTALNAMSGQFKKRLEDIETQQKSLMNEKRAVEKALRENTEKMGRVEQERDFYHKQADGLKMALDNLNSEKECTMKELQEEHMARELAERQLSAAERALSHLEMAMRLSGKHINELRDQIMPDVCSLREFFEEIAEKSVLNSKSPQIMKDAVSARATFLTKNKTRLRNSIRQAKRAQRRLCKLGGSDDDETSSRTTTSEDMSTTSEVKHWRQNVTMI